MASRLTHDMLTSQFARGNGTLGIVPFMCLQANPLMNPFPKRRYEMDGRDDEVGFGKPPEKNRFIRGRSGNPKGRPRGSKNVNAILVKVERQRVKVNGEWGSRVITKLEAAYTQL